MLERKCSLKTLTLISEGIVLALIIIVIIACILVAAVFYSMYYGPRKTIKYGYIRVFVDNRLVVNLLLVVPYLRAFPFLLLYYALKGILVASGKLIDWTLSTIFGVGDD